MPFIRMRVVLVPALLLLARTLMIGSVAQANTNDNLPIYTSPIDITGGRAQSFPIATAESQLSSHCLAICSDQR